MNAEKTIFAPKAPAKNNPGKGDTKQPEPVTYGNLIDFVMAGTKRSDAPFDIVARFARKHRLAYDHLVDILLDFGCIQDEDVFECRMIPRHEIIGGETFVTSRSRALHYGYYCRSLYDNEPISLEKALLMNQVPHLRESLVLCVPCKPDDECARLDIDKAREEVIDERTVKNHHIREKIGQLTQTGLNAPPVERKRMAAEIRRLRAMPCVTRQVAWGSKCEV